MSFCDMVLQKRLDYGFNGYKVPAVPQASRSARGRSTNRKKVEENQMCAFELLATIAGSLLQAEECFPHSRSNKRDAVKQEWHEEEKPSKVEPCDEGINDESVLDCQRNNQNCLLKELPQAQNCVAGLSSIITKSNLLGKISCADNMVINKRKDALGSSHIKVEGSSSCHEESYEGKLKDGIRKNVGVETLKICGIIDETMTDVCSSGYPLELDIKPGALVNSVSSVEEPLCSNYIPSDSFPGCQDDVKLFSRDDDENSSGCTQPSTRMNAFRPPPCIGDERMRKLFSSKYWKLAPSLKDGEIFNTDEVMKTIYHNKKTRYTRQRSQRNSPYKRRKLFDQSSISTFEGGISSEVISNSTEKDLNGDAAGSGARELGASGLPSSVKDQRELFKSGGSQSSNSCVKLSIKSFKIPELFIEIPETETVGSLKRAVMEAVTSILGGGLHVGVFLQGKKVGDDSKTLLQTGIFHENKLDSLGFMLEPNPSQTPPSLHPENSPFMLPCETLQPLTRRYPAGPHVNLGTSDASPDPPSIDMGNFFESDHDSVPSPDSSNDKASPDARALVAIPMSVEALAVVPLHRKSRRSKLVQRRIRRPFSVSEVEALVQAVETLGTGRWRDVKMSAFDNAKHRTYVDLKDKWKTLVHTARISPQQRRGEPVPQELLDRVLTAHTYWSQQQAKQQMKKQSQACLLL